MQQKAIGSRPRPRKLLVDEVRDKLRDTLVHGVYLPGAQLPPENELGEMFRVSRITLREAVRGLVEEGYLSRQHGLGTFVTQKPKLRHNLDVNFGVTQLIRNIGMTPGNQDVSSREEPAEASIAKSLNLKAGDPVVRFERLRTADGSPIVYSVEYIPAHLLRSGAERVRTLAGSLYELLAKLGEPVHYGIASLKPTVADAAMAQRLNIKKHTPLLCLEQVDYRADDQPLLVSVEWYRPDLVEFTVYRKGPSLPSPR